MATKSRSNLQLQEEEPPSEDYEDFPPEMLFSSQQTSILLEQNVDEVQMFLQEYMNLTLPQYNMYEAILLDYYVSGLCWAKEMNFTVDQLTGFMNLLHILMVNLESRNMTLEDNFKEVGRAMIGVGQSQAEKQHMLGALTVDQAKDVITYLKNSLFQHYKLYEFMVNSSRDELVIGTEQVIEVVEVVDTPFPAPLEEGMPYEIYARFIAPESPTSESQEPEENDSEETQEVKEEIDPLAGFTLDDVKSVLGQVTKEVIGNLETEINEKLRLQEEMYTERIEKLKST
ncbi:ciliary-associated calcium-binding coiled-coil protein 1 [Ambystoma mexicanum]|uniref:ciliary-associated calcium-binding coiled-coil protein 1 n=1 Tax=Ambystoma mexicanum TaxID=8296 RepID=UPI0037E7649B